MLDSIHGCLFLISSISIIALCNIVYRYIMDKQNINHKGIKLWLTVLILSIIMNVLLPTTRKAIAIYGINKAVGYIKNQKNSDKLPEEFIEDINMMYDNNER